MRFSPRPRSPTIAAVALALAMLFGGAVGWLLNEPEPPKGVTVYIGEETE